MDTPIQVWLQQMKSIWLSKEPDRIAQILSEESLEYYESPFAPPLVSIEAVVTAWQGIKNQNIEFVNIELLHETVDAGVALWKFKEGDKAEHMGMYFLKLDSHCKCKYFRQFWNQREVVTSSMQEAF